ncbi:uncharacterized protein LOC135102162 [Scylla paramamosain]|uniref:uncharacterized protein LOC135102162 n=1 Tax=Scylla paramamosain TaxID=85552 RepID=UPI003082B406
MAARRVEMFLLSRSVHDLYTLTKEELCSVAERFQVELKSKKKEEMQAELKNALVERSWFENDGGESEDNGEESVGEGWARHAYVNLSDQEAIDYEVVKEAVLGPIRPCPEVYRERFRRTTKRPGDTYLGMAREVILKLDRWLKAEEATTLEEVKGVIQMEQFMSQMPLSVRCELASHDVKDVMEAGRRADKYCAVRGLNGDEHHGGRKPFSNRNDGHQRYMNDRQMSSTSVHRSNQPRPNNYSFPHTYTMPPPADHNMRSTPYRSRPRSTTYYQKDSGDEGAVKCLGCGSSGHRKFQCPKGRPKPVGAVAAQRDLIKYVENMTAQIQEESQRDEGFEHFTSEGTVKVEGSPQKVIRILRDTGANQSLILSSVLPWNEETSTGREVSCKSAGGKFSIPLHKVWLDCGYVTGEVTAGVKETLPVHGVDMLVGNDLAGGRVIPKLKIKQSSGRNDRGHHSGSSPSLSKWGGGSA